MKSKFIQSLVAIAGLLPAAPAMAEIKEPPKPGDPCLVQTDSGSVFASNLPDKMAVSTDANGFGEAWCQIEFVEVQEGRADRGDASAVSPVEAFKRISAR